MTWKDITIRKYVELYEVMQRKTKGIKGSYEVLAVLYDKPVEYFDNIPVKLLTKMLRESKFIYSKPVSKGIPTILKLNGKKYIINVNPSEFIGGQYIDASSYCKSEETINRNYHNIISLLLSPYSLFSGNKFTKLVKKAKTKDELVVVYDKINKERNIIADELYNHLTMDVVFQLSEYFFLLYQNLTKTTMDCLDKEIARAKEIVKTSLNTNGMRDIGDGI